ncbi:MAG: hypothetical protein DSY43_04585 [Gammaproteobacteria bacterium]|nr:MAG: hypothetical protein DSY43_04585 [Gammaproteobacteria bacterium]
MRFYKVAIGMLLLFWSFLSYAQSTYQWVQIAPNNQLSVRVILSDKEQCPMINIDNKPTYMKLRAPKAGFFPAVCELLVSRDTHSIKIKQQALPTLPNEINRVAILGDTGCRISKHSVQACNDARAWPLRELNASIASKKVDVILHLGDYLYRENPCPEGNKGCEGSPSGYNWEAWNADWFSVADSLFQSSVMVFSRGNHEDCSRADNGWFRYMSPWEYKEIERNCTEMEKPYMFKLQNMNYIMFDSNYGHDDSTSDAQLALYKETIEQLKIDKNLTNVLITHRPMWTYYKFKSKFSFGNLTQQIAFKGLLPDNTLFIAGHSHYLQLLDMESDYDQIIIGNSGTKLDDIGNIIQKSVDIDKHMANFVYSRSGFGYGILTITDQIFRFYNQDGVNTGECSWLAGKQYSSLNCQ